MWNDQLSYHIGHEKQATIDYRYWLKQISSSCIPKMNEWMQAWRETEMDRWLNDPLKWMKEKGSTSKPLFSTKTARKGAVARLLRGIRADSSSLVRRQFTSALHCTWLTVWPVTLKEVTGVLRKTGLLSHNVVQPLGQLLQSVCTLPLLLSHRLSLESFDVFALAAAANGSINKQNSPVLCTHNLWILTFHWCTDFYIIVKLSCMLTYWIIFSYFSGDLRECLKYQAGLKKHSSLPYHH